MYRVMYKDAYQYVADRDGIFYDELIHGEPEYSRWNARN